MAPQADEGAFELRRTRDIGPLVERVKHDAGGFVVRRDLEDVAPAHPSERNAIVEEHGARVLFTDLLSLQAGPREDQQLRIDRDLQRLQR